MDIFSLLLPLYFNQNIITFLQNFERTNSFNYVYVFSDNTQILADEVLKSIQTPYIFVDLSKNLDYLNQPENTTRFSMDSSIFSLVIVETLSSKFQRKIINTLSLFRKEWLFLFPRFLRNSKQSIQRPLNIFWSESFMNVVLQAADDFATPSNFFWGFEVFPDFKLKKQEILQKTNANNLRGFEINFLCENIMILCAFDKTKRNSEVFGMFPNFYRSFVKFVNGKLKITKVLPDERVRNEFEFRTVSLPYEGSQFEYPRRTYNSLNSYPLQLVEHFVLVPGPKEADRKTYISRPFTSKVCLMLVLSLF